MPRESPRSWRSERPSSGVTDRVTPRRPRHRPLTELETELKSVFGAPGGATLDRVAAVIAGLSDDPVGTEAIIAQFDDLAAAAPGVCADADAVLSFVFGEQGFRGNHREYYSPNNSYIDHVLATRRGIPITLAVVAIETGRRLGVALTPVGFPSHFLVGDGSRPDRWFDPFEAGRSLDPDACQDLLTRIHPGARLDISHTAVLEPAEVAHRMLINLRHIHLTLGDLSRATAVAELSVMVPGAGLAHRVELIKLLNATGRFDAAAAQHERLALLDPAHEAEHHVAAKRLRFHLN